MEWPGPDRVLGLAAYDTWAAALLRDEDFPAGDLKMLTFRCNVNGGVTYSGLRDARRCAIEFLRNTANEVPEAPSGILQAAAAYEAEARILDAKTVPWCGSPEEERIQMASRKFRTGLAEVILAAKEADQKAIELLEQAVQELQV